MNKSYTQSDQTKKSIYMNRIPIQYILSLIVALVHLPFSLSDYFLYFEIVFITRGDLYVSADRLTSLSLLIMIKYFTFSLTYCNAVELWLKIVYPI